MRTEQHESAVVVENVFEHARSVGHVTSRVGAAWQGVDETV